MRLGIGRLRSAGSATDPGSGRRRATARGAAVILIGAGISAFNVAPSAAAPVGKPAKPGPVSESTAIASAVKTGKPVTISALTSPTQLAVANPSGTVTVSFDAEPVRAQTPDGTWIPVDTTLTSVSGSIVPKAAAVSLAFSVGGSRAPLATMTKGQQSYSIFAPWTLPAPTVSGSTATYVDVLTGVDLVVVAQADGFSENLVIKNAQAAANPALASITFPTSSKGLESWRDPSSGAVLQRDVSGRTVFSSSTASMWDSAGVGTEVTAKVGAAHSAAAVTAGSHTAKAAPMAVLVTPTSETVIPDPALLKDPTVTYPLVLDPMAATSSISGWSVLDRQYPNNAYWKDSPDPAGALGVGYEGYTTGTARRSVVQFNTSALAGKHILAATFEAYEIWSANCTAYEMDVWRTSSISSSNTWNHQPTWIHQDDSRSFATGWTGSGSKCTAQSAEDFNVLNAVTTTAGAPSATTTLGMRAASESTLNDWKQFATPTGSHKPSLSVTYITKPSVPTSVKMKDPNVSCSTSSAAPTLITDTTPMLQATVPDDDGASATLRANFEVYNGTTKTWSGNSTGSYVASGTIVNATTSALAAGVVYHYHARTEYYWVLDTSHSGSDYSGWSSDCYFKIDASAPAAPTVTSATYLPCGSVDTPDLCAAYGGVGQSGTFTFTGEPDVTTFTYSFNGGSPTSVTATTNGTIATASASLTPTVKDVNFLQVTAKDGAGNTSKSAEYDFKVNKGSDPVAVWNFDDGTGTTAADSTTRGTAHPLTGDYWWRSQGRLGTAVTVSDATGYGSTSSAVVDTTKSFAVSMWVMVYDATVPQTFLSQDGVHQSGFQLGYDPTSGFYFGRPASDADGATSTYALNSTFKERDWAWTHVAGVYDAVGKKVTVYVNGVPGTPVSYTPSLASNGAVQVGRGLINSAYGNYCNCWVDQVQMWDRVIAVGEIGEAVQITDPSTGLAQPEVMRDWQPDDSDGTWEMWDQSGYNFDLYLDGGAVFQPDDAGTHGAVIGLDGTAGFAESGFGGLWSSGYDGIDCQGSFTATAWVKVDSTRLSATGAQTAYVLAKAGGQQSTWTIYYQQTAGPSTGYWYFGRANDSTTTAAMTSLKSDNPAQTDDWVWLAVVYDSAKQRMHLYINGFEQGSSDGVPYTTPWQAKGLFSAGVALRNGSWGGYLPGEVDNVTLSAGVTDQQTLLTQWLNGLAQ